MHILIIKLGALGDVINTFPAVTRIQKHFNAQVDWLVEPLSHGFVADHPSVNHAILFNKGKKKAVFQTLRKLREKKYDMTLDFQRTLKSGFFCLMSRSLMKIGFDKKRCKEMTWLYPFTRIHHSDSGKHMLLQYMDFADFLGADECPVTWDLNPGKEQKDGSLPDRYMVLNIGATKKANLWKVGQFARLSDLIQVKLGVSVVMTGGPEDMERAKKITMLVDKPFINLCGQTSLAELKCVLYYSQLVVSCDTGPMHLSVALGKKTVALFGPSNPRRTGPYPGFGNGIVVQKQTDCSPCNQRKCENPICMELIKAEDVFEHIRELDS